MAVAHSGSAIYNVTSGMVAAGTVEFPIRVSALFQGARGAVPHGAFALFSRVWVGRAMRAGVTCTHVAARSERE